MAHGTITEFKVSTECLLRAVIDTVMQKMCYPPIWLGGNFFKAKPKKIYQLVFTSLTLARAFCIHCSIEPGNMVWPRVLGHSDDQGAFLDHSVTCAEWLAKKPRRDERPWPKTFSGRWHVQQGQEARFRKIHHAN